MEWTTSNVVELHMYPASVFHRPPLSQIFLFPDNVPTLFTSATTRHHGIEYWMGTYPPKITEPCLTKQFGLGSMGLHMALNLQKHLQGNSLPPLHYSNRSMSKGQPLQDAGAIPESDFESLVQASDIIFTMVRHLHNACTQLTTNYNYRSLMMPSWTP